MQTQVTNSKKALTLKLITTGRVTRLPHIVELRFCNYNGSFFVIPGGKKSDWVLNCLAHRAAKVKIGELVYMVSVRPATDEERNEIIKEFERKYGASVIKKWYRQTNLALCLTPSSTPVKRTEIKGELDSSKSITEWKAQMKNYYSEVAFAFDLASEEYDFTIKKNFINTWVRERSISILTDYLKPNDTVIEIGCGTGEEAIRVCKFVNKIVAIDISEKMIELLQRKIRAMKLIGKIIPLRLSAAEVIKVRNILPNGSARVAYSFNGALNCEPKINLFIEGLANLIEPNGYFICSIRNSLCLSEAVSHAIVMQFTKMNPRKKQPIMVSVGGIDIPAIYYSPRRFAKLFSKHFNVRKIIALPAFLPPAYLSNYYIRVRRFASILERLENILADKEPFRNFGDQTLFVFQRKGDDRPR